MPEEPVGAVLVVGGGVGGIQAALDLAECGIKVYLVEREPAIGGVMAQLDKTFPTNDCAMCTLAPRLVEAGRHKDVELLTLSEVVGLRGEPGDFTVTVLKHPRYIDEEKCRGCGQCSAHCPVRCVIQPVEVRSAGERLKPEEKALIDRILSRYEGEKGILVSVLHDINKEFRYLPKDILRYTSERLGMPLSQVYHAATFYTSFSLTPRGLYHVKVCMGTSCYVRGAASILEEFERQLGVQAGETTSDLVFTLETINCPGSCASGPLVMVNERAITMTSEDVERVIEECRAEVRKTYETAAVSQRA